MARVVPTAWLQVPIPIPCATGSSTRNNFTIRGATIEPTMPVKITAAIKELCYSPYFGVVLSIFMYQIGVFVSHKLKTPVAKRFIQTKQFTQCKDDRHGAKRTYQCACQNRQQIMLLVFGLLLWGPLKVYHIRKQTDFLLDNMAFFFIPPAVSIVENLHYMEGKLLILIFICFIIIFIKKPSLLKKLKHFLYKVYQLGKKGKRLAHTSPLEYKTYSLLRKLLILIFICFISTFTTFAITAWTVKAMIKLDEKRKERKKRHASS